MGMFGIPISDALSAINSSIELVRTVSAAPGTLDKAEMKLKLADTMAALADAKMSLIAARQELHAMAEEVDELQAALRTKGETVRVHDALYLKGPEGDPAGDPHCLPCWEAHHVLFSILRSEGNNQSSFCPSCKTTFTRRLTPFSVHLREPA